jgi:hypothetical protein
MRVSKRNKAVFISRAASSDRFGRAPLDLNADIREWNFYYLILISFSCIYIEL